LETQAALVAALEAMVDFQYDNGNECQCGYLKDEGGQHADGCPVPAAELALAEMRGDAAGDGGEART